jgi:DNA-directed RNA polymerase subunit RPC12/RpoP
MEIIISLWGHDPHKPAYGARPFYPDHYWCTHCGTDTKLNATDAGWKRIELCQPDEAGALRCPDCGFKVRTHAQPYEVIRAKKRLEKRESERVRRSAEQRTN